MRKWIANKLRCLAHRVDDPIETAIRDLVAARDAIGKPITMEQARAKIRRILED